MKRLYLIGGTMGVGKTAACQLLKKKLNNAVFLDGDWCWDADPFIVTDETKAMALDNIRFLLNSFLRCSAYENVIFCWVMHQQSIIDSILSKLDTQGCEVLSVSLCADAPSLTARLQGDIDVGIRQPDVLPRSLARVPLYESLNTIKIDTSHLTAQETAEVLAALK